MKCVICGKETGLKRLHTCSDECHDKLIDKLVAEFGEFKEVVDVHTGIAYNVPTRYILENGLKYEDLKNFPVIE